MNIEILTALAAFAFVSSVTPGPNNLMLMASGANFGIRRTIPHFLGVVFGFLLMILLLGLGTVEIFSTWPVAYEVLRVLSIAYLLYLAYKIASAKPGQVDDAGSPLSALQAALFQWVNPKAWAMAVTALTVYAPSQVMSQVLLVALVCALVNSPSVFVWVVMGSRLRGLLSNPRRLRFFNWSMAALLLASLYPVVLGR